MPQESAASLLMRIDDVQRHLHALLSDEDEALLARRPPSGQWSVLENVRHLLFAEQAHLRRFITKPQPWSPLGLAPPSVQRKLAIVGSKPPTSVKEVLQAWQAIHQPAGEMAQQDTAEVRKALAGNLRHLQGHTKVIERLIRAHSRSKK
jgi:hypothetical protein